VLALRRDASLGKVERWTLSTFAFENGERSFTWQPEAVATMADRWRHGSPNDTTDLVR
jgi:hypothetical protein